MNIFEMLASTASIISIPLAIYYAHKNNNTTNEKARLDIIKTLSYRLSAIHTLKHEDIDSVYKSKLREHEITNAKFNQEDILNDLKSDIMSNAFLDNEVRNKILYNLSQINFVHTRGLIYSSPKFLTPFIKLFVSPIPYILFVANIIICIILLFPYVIDFIFLLLYNPSYNDLHMMFIEIFYYDIYLDISLICLLFLSVTCFFRKKYLKKCFKILY